ncbi:hypothetical protein [uncultured Pseudoalteromonas sp.]|uniref:hypothetical protein n=1 Tax=unclassified Pseudoalteromonas TaxID=194690 RepID=UPI0030DD708D|tara:strand:+ start:6458 stop:7534 length:1077 start_codon:yes stop_codon:yes gene_type:complete
MDEFITFNTALALISSNKETDINVKAIKLIDLYLNGDIDLYIELNGKRGKRSFPYSPLPQAYNPLDDLLRLLEGKKGEDAFKGIDNLVKKGWDSNSSSELQNLIFSAVKDTYYTRVDDGEQVRYIPNELIEKSFISNTGGSSKQQIKQSYDYECSYFSEDELYKLEGAFKVPLEVGSYHLERFKKALFYGEGDDELSGRGIDLQMGGVDRVVSLDGQIWTLYSHERHKSNTLSLKGTEPHPDIIFPDINVFLLNRDQVVEIDKVTSQIVKRPNATKRNQFVQRQIVDAALYELAHNYNECLRSGVVMASKVVEAFTLNHKVHWPDGCGIDKETGRIKDVPLSNEKMIRLVRDVIKKKN